MSMSKVLFVLPIVLALSSIVSCELVDDEISKHTGQSASINVGLDVVAEILAAVPIEKVHLKEVHTAVTSSSGNGYDEEYTMRNLFASPGAGVGDVSSTKVGDFSENPLKELIKEHIRTGSLKTRAGGCPCQTEPELFLKALMESDVQIYWPFSDLWDGETYPIITFDPMDGGETNIGYMIVGGEGDRRLEKVIVDEKMAAEHPVWVVNRNSDAGFKTLELLRREDPDWGEGGGSIIINPSKSQCGIGSSLISERCSGEISGSSYGKNPAKTTPGLKSLILKDFVMKRNFDTWFAGASEFFVKAGYVKDFTASTEAELKLYNPSVTDFMVVVKRNQIGKPQSFNAMLISDWSPQMDACAFMITEDDGGTRTEWKCTALVRIASKSYGFEMVLPFNSRDDVVWRGQLSSRWLESETDIVSHFGDVDVTFSVI